jgi:hypothetical protein
VIFKVLLSVEQKVVPCWNVQNCRAAAQVKALTLVTRLASNVALEGRRLTRIVYVPKTAAAKVLQL